MEDADGDGQKAFHRRSQTHSGSPHEGPSRVQVPTPPEAKDPPEERLRGISSFLLAGRIGSGSFESVPPDFHLFTSGTIAF